MNFPSLKSLSDSTKQVCRRFPFEILFAFIGTIAAIFHIELDAINDTADNWCLRILMTANLGLLLSLACTLFIESNSIKNLKAFMLKLMAALLAASMLFLINPMAHQADQIRFFLLSLSFHLLVSFSAFIRRGTIQGFWQFNKTLFLRFLSGLLYSTVLFSGLAAALGAMNFLFGFNFEYDTFVILWFCIAGIFNTVFFLAGLPENLQALDEDFSYPKGLKVFTQYVLIPLATVYLVILLAYEIKILAEWNLPKGLVSNLILGYAVFGILSLLLVFPIREQEGNKWIKTYAKSFYFLLLPLLVLLFLAIGNRVFRYGITESRYFLIVLACWLLFISVYFLISRKQNIRLIPISLCILTLFSVYGPQSAFSVSCYSQKRILINVFKKNHAFNDGRLLPMKKISVKDAQRAMATLSHLIRQYDLEVLQPYMDKDLSKVTDSLNKKNKANSYRGYNRFELQEEKIKWANNYLGFSKFSDYRGMFSVDNNSIFDNSYTLRSIQNEVAVVKGYDYIIEQSNYENGRTHNIVDQLTVQQTFKENSQLMISIDKEAVTFDLNSLMKSLISDSTKLKEFRIYDTDQTTDPKSYEMPQYMLMFNKKTKHFSITYRINSIFFKSSKNKVLTVTELQGLFLIKKLN